MNSASEIADTIQKIVNENATYKKKKILGIRIDYDGRSNPEIFIQLHNGAHILKDKDNILNSNARKFIDVLKKDHNYYVFTTEHKIVELIGFFVHKKVIKIFFSNYDLITIDKFRNNCKPTVWY